MEVDGVDRDIAGGYKSGGGSHGSDLEVMSLRDRKTTNSLY